MAEEIMALSKQELRDEVAALRRRNRSRSIRERIRSADAAELTGFLGGTVALGYLEEKGMLPATVGNIDTELIIGGLALVMSRGKTDRRSAMLRGMGYGALAGFLKDTGRRFAQG